MTKIAFFAEILVKEFDGATRTMFQLIDRIDDTRQKFMFIYGKGPRLFRNFQTLRIPTFQLPINNDYALALPVLIQQRLERELDRFDPDVVHLSTPSPLGFFALSYAKKRGIPVTTIYHTHFVSYIPYYFKHLPFLMKPVERWMLGAMQKFYNQCEKIYTPSHSMIRYLSDCGIDESRTLLWQRGVDLTLFNPYKRNKSYLRSITGNDKPTILFASRLVWEKNIKTLIKVHDAVKEKNMRCNIVVAGEGNAYKEAKAMMPESFFVGKLAHKELAVLYASADIFLFTSVSETYGNVVTEAMASGLPCVIADGGGSADLVLHNQTGFKASPMDVEEYITYINLLLEQPLLRQVMADNALRSVQQLNWATLAQRYFRDLDSLAVQKLASWPWVAG